MKVFLVFLALFLVNITFLVYQGDMNRYVQIQAFLKAVAEECAAGASLYYDEEEYGRGKMVIDKGEAMAYGDYIVSRAEGDPSLGGRGSLSWDMEIVDDNSEETGEGNSPSVTVRIHLNTPDLFRLPFLEVCQVSRDARYEIAQW